MASHEDVNLEIYFWKPGPQGGAEVQYYTVKLNNARIVSIAASTSDSPTMLDQEIVSFDHYNGIELTINNGGPSYTAETLRRVS